MNCRAPGQNSDCKNLRKEWWSSGGMSRRAQTCTRSLSPHLEVLSLSLTRRPAERPNHQPTNPLAAECIRLVPRFEFLDCPGIIPDMTDRSKKPRSHAPPPSVQHANAPPPPQPAAASETPAAATPAEGEAAAPAAAPDAAAPAPAPAPATAPDAAPVAGEGEMPAAVADAAVAAAADTPIAATTSTVPVAVQ